MADEVLSKSPLFTLFSSPTEYFSTRKPKLGFIWLAVTLSIVSALMEVIMVPYVLHSPQYLQLFSKMTSQQDAMAKAIMPISTIVGGLIAPWLSVVVLGFLYWLLAKLFGYSITYRNAAALGAHVALFQLIGVVVSVIVTVATGSYVISLLSLGTMVPSSGIMTNILSRISVFDIWALFIVTIGLAVYTGGSKSKTVWIGVVVWILSMFI